MKWIIAMVALGLAGCSTTGDITSQPVNIVGSDLCEIQKEKLTWDMADTKQTIRGIRRFNAKWDSRCLNKKGSPTS